MIAVLLVLLAVGGGVAAMLSQAAAPSADATLAALRAYELAAAGGDWSIAESTASALPAAAAELDSGKVLLALDALIAGDVAQALEQSRDLQALGGELGARSSLIYAAASRLGSVDGYAEAIAAYGKVASCKDAPCNSIRARAERARRESCVVLGPSARGCVGMPVLEKRAQSLSASLVLLEDGHSDRAQLVLVDALSQGEADGSCLENAVLARWAAEASLSRELRDRVKSAGVASARSPEQCALFSP